MMAATPGVSFGSKPAHTALAGMYSVRGFGLDGQTYGGSVQVLVGANGYQVTWSIDGDKHQGMGQVSGDILNVFSSDGGRLTVTMAITDDHTLTGTWSSAGRPGTGTERWVRW